MFVAVRKGIDKIYVEMRPCRALTPAGRQGVHRCLGRGRCLHRPAGVRLDDGFAPPAGKSRIVGRAISPADAGGDRRAVCGISQAIAPKGCGSQKVSGGRERPPYKLTGNVCRAFCHLLAARHPGPMKIIGPYAKARATRKEPSNTRRQCTPPASLTRCHLPLQGRLSKQQPPAKPPLQGEVDAPSGADGGVRRLAAPLPLRVGRGASPPL